MLIGVDISVANSHGCECASMQSYGNGWDWEAGPT